MSDAHFESCLHSIRDSPLLHCPYSIRLQLEGLEGCSDFSSHFLHLVSYSLSRLNLFRNTGCISLSSALSPAAPQEHYAFPCFAPLYQFLGYEPETCDVSTKSLRSAQNPVANTLISSNEQIYIQSINGEHTSINNTTSINSTPDYGSENTTDSDELFSNQQSTTKNRPKSYTELHLQHLKRSIPRLKPTKYANLYFLKTLSRPATCPNIVLVEDTGSCGVTSFFKSMCHRVNNIYNSPPIQSIFSTVYSTVIGERQCPSMAHRSLELQCYNNYSSDFAKKRVLSTIQESKRIIRLFNRREKQKDGTWGKKPRRSSISPSEPITQALLRAKAAIEQNTSNNKLELNESANLDQAVLEKNPRYIQLCNNPSSSSEDRPAIQNRDKIVDYFKYLSNYPILKWNPVAIVDFNPIQHDISTFDICSEINFNLGTIHKEAGTKIAKRSILIGYKKYRFSYRHQLFRARLFYHILSSSSIYKLDNDKYYYNSLNDCMDLHIEQETVEKRKGHFNPLSLHAVLCGVNEEENHPNEIMLKPNELVNTIQSKKIDEIKKNPKKNTKINSRCTILDQIAKASKKSHVAIDGKASEPPRKQSFSEITLSSDSFLKLFFTSLTSNMKSSQSTGESIIAPPPISCRGLVQYKYQLINENPSDDQIDLAFISIPLCEVSPFNCSHLFMLKDVASDIIKYKSMACEALILVSYNVNSWQISRHTLSLRPDIRQLSNLIHFWGDTVNMPLLYDSRSTNNQSNNMYVDVIESCSSLCSGFLSLSGSSYLSLHRDGTEHETCIVNIEYTVTGESVSPAVRYTLLSQKGSLKRYKIDFVPDARPLSPQIEHYISYLQLTNKDAVHYNMLPNMDQIDMCRDILSANGETVARRMTDTIDMALQMINYGAPDSIFGGLSILDKAERAQFLKNDPVCLSNLHDA